MLRKMSPFLYDYKFMSNYYGKYSDEALFHPLRREPLLENPPKLNGKLTFEPLPTFESGKLMNVAAKTIKKEENIEQSEQKKGKSASYARYFLYESIEERSVMTEFDRKVASSPSSSYEEYRRLSSANEEEEFDRITKSPYDIRAILDKHSEKEKQLQHKYALAIAAHDGDELLHKHLHAWARLRGLE